MNTLTLQLNMLGYWHCGTGLASGNAIDASCQRDVQGLPFVPGRTLKGLLREALNVADATVLFGRDESGQHSSFGVLRVTGAYLPDADRAAIARETDASALIASLFKTIYQTAIDEVRGVARNQSLRAIEVAVPLNLIASVSVVPGQQAPSGWEESIKAAARKIHAIGAHRARGLGRARITAVSSGGAQ